MPLKSVAEYWAQNNQKAAAEEEELRKIAQQTLDGPIAERFEGGCEVASIRMPSISEELVDDFTYRTFVRICNEIAGPLGFEVFKRHEGGYATLVVQPKKENCRG